MRSSAALSGVIVIGFAGAFACSGTQDSGGQPQSGGAKSSGGTTASGSSSGGPAGSSGASNGGASSAGATSALGGASQMSEGGTPGRGGSLSSGGAAATSGEGAAGGIFGAGGATAAGSTGKGGLNGAGGKSGSGGASAAGAGGTAGTAGKSGTGGTGESGGKGGEGGVPAVTGPCDIYGSGNTPCVAAHSTVRALYGAYNGKLYQVRRASDQKTQDIAVLAPGGFANSAAQDTFCTGTTCTISILYDQSPKGNHLTKAPPGGNKSTPGNEASATGLKLMVGGHSVYAIYVNTGIGYRNDKTSGIATGDQPEGEYMVTSGTHYNAGCCFDYGNAETTNNDDGNGTMEAVYFGNSTGWGKGNGKGPWVMADLENGLFAGQSFAANSNNTPLTNEYVTALIKGKAGHFALRGGNAQSGALKTMYDGGRPSGGYDPMKKQGAIILGIGGDNSNSATGTFFEGCMTSGYPSDASDDAVQANIVAAGYGH